MASNYIIPLTGDLTVPLELLGGKGYNLQRLVHANFHVPSGFAITTRAYRETVQVILDSGRPWDGAEQFSALVQDTPIPPLIAGEILDAARNLRMLTGGALVARSSATSEDSQHSSMAGQAASFVNLVSDHELLSAVRGCWASLFTREGMTYRSALQPGDDFPEMAVVVQQLIPAWRAGVLFTINPVSGSRDECVISASWGLGETVVSGRESDTFTIDTKSLEIIDRELAVKGRQLVPDSKGGTREEVVQKARADRPVLDDQFCKRLVKLAQRVERVFGSPQDLEWAEWDGRVYLLQARPVTATHRKPRRTVWSNANVGEALPGVGTPYTWSIIHSFSRQGFIHAFRGLGCTVPDDCAIIGNIRGRVYLNLSEFMSVLSQIPFVTPQLMLQVAGGGGGDLLQGTFRKMPRSGFIMRSPFTVARMLLSRAVSPARIALWSQRFKRFQDAFPFDSISQLSRDELGDLLRQIDSVFEDTGTLMLEVSSHFLMDYMGTSLLLKELLGSEARQLERKLLSGLTGVQSAEPGLDLLRMAQRVATSEELVASVLNIAPDKLLPMLKEGTDAQQSLASAIEAFLRSHGHRAAREAELAEPRWSEDPTFPLSVLQKYLQDPRAPDPETMLAERARMRDAVTSEVLGDVPRRFRPLLRRMLNTTRQSARVREQMRDAVVHTMAFYRHFALETGRRLRNQRLLRDANEVFFLTKEELRDFVNGEDSLAVPVRTAMRRMKHEALLSLPDLPSSFVMEGERPLLSRVDIAQGMRLPGLAGSPGLATGAAVIVKHPSDGQKVKPGDILVAPFTDVGWTPLFLVAGAVVTELGGPLSHSCVVAREYGVPAVVNVAEATTILKDGDTVTVDGDNGVVLVER